MTDKTFTDEEIVRALEHCSAYDADLCADCPMFGRCHKEPNLLEREALDLINRQKAKIERLKQAYANYEETTGLKQAKTEVVREIFEEIEKVLKKHHKSYGLYGEFKTRAIMEEFAEIEKKYTEEEE